MSRRRDVVISMKGHRAYIRFKREDAISSIAAEGSTHVTALGGCLKDSQAALVGRIGGMCVCVCVRERG